MSERRRRGRRRVPARSLSTVHLSSPRVAKSRCSPSKMTVRFVGSALPAAPSLAWATPNTMRRRRPSERSGPAKLRRMPLPSGRAAPSHSSSAFLQSTSRFKTPRIRARKKPLPPGRQPLDAERSQARQPRPRTRARARESSKDQQCRDRLFACNACTRSLACLADCPSLTRW